jgi:hypothetical protein
LLRSSHCSNFSHDPEDLTARLASKVNCQTHDRSPPFQPCLVIAFPRISRVVAGTGEITLSCSVLHRLFGGGLRPCGKECPYLRTMPTLSSHAKHSSQSIALRETWLRKQTARREVMIDYCLYRHRSPAAECSLSQEHTPVSRLSCAWQGSMHGGCRALSQRQRPRLVSSRLVLTVFTHRCRNAHNPPTYVQPTTGFRAPRLIAQDMACLHVRPPTNHASPDQARMGRIGCSQGSRKPPFLVSVRNLISHAAGTMYP